jgi:hypothetical protein
MRQTLQTSYTGQTAFHTPDMPPYMGQTPYTGQIASLHETDPPYTPSAYMHGSDPYTG